MQKSTSSSPRRGRPPVFDRDAVVASAVRSFWVDGYEGTTLADLERSTGVDRSTLYNSFGGKAGLYEAATGHYLEQARTGLFGPVYDGAGDGLDDIVEVLGRLRDGLTHPDSLPGCLVVNDMAAGPDADVARRYLALVREGMVRALARTGATTAEADARADLLTAVVVGVNLVHRTTGDETLVDQMLSATVEQVRAWRKAAPPG